MDIKSIGKLKVSKDNMLCNEQIMILDEEDYLIASIDVGDLSSEEAVKEAEGVANLLAAAPDMYEALIQARGALNIDAMFDGEGKPYDTTVEAIMAINKSLDKAEGMGNDVNS